MLSQFLIDGVFILSGNRQFFPGDTHAFRGYRRGFRQIDEKGAVDTEETGTERVLPLADAGFVAVLLTVARMDPDFRIAGFDVQDILFPD